MTPLKEARQLLSLFKHTFREVARKPWRGPQVTKQMHETGVRSLGIVLIASAFGGFVATSEMAFHMKITLGTLDMIPGFGGQFVFRELGVAVAALLLVARAGAAMTAQIAGMKNSDQLDAMRVLGADPVSEIVYPRFVGMVLASGALTVIAVSVSLWFAALAAVMKYGFTWLEYLRTLSVFIRPLELGTAFFKGIVFGGVIPVVSCYYGFHCKPGASGVGSATTNSVVTSTVVIIILDCLLNLGFSFVQKIA